MNVSLQFPSSLSRLVAAEHHLEPEIANAVHSAVASAIGALGIPAQVRVTVAADGPEFGAGGRVFRVIANDRTIRYPDELLRTAWCCITHQTLNPEVTPSFIHARLNEHAESAAAADRARITQFLSLACSKAVELQPSRLFGIEECRAYAGTLPAHVDRTEEWLIRVLGQVLDLHISIADQRAVASALGDERDEAAAVEHLISALRRDSIDLLLTKTSMRSLTASLDAVDSSTMFPFLRDGLLEELGAPMPRYRFVIAEEQPQGTFAFRVNDFMSVPLFGLQPGTLMVNDTDERMRHAGFGDATAIANPATQQPNAVIDVSRADEAQEKGFTTWNELGHLILSFAEFLRSYGWCTIDRAGVLQQLHALEAAFPALVKLAQGRYGDDALTALIRALVRDRVSVQNLRGILESVVDLTLLNEGYSEDVDQAVSAESRDLAYVRTALGAAIAHQAARTTDTIVVYLLDPAIERLADQPLAQFDRHGDSVLTALRNEMAYLPPTAQIPVILTTSPVRNSLQRLVAAEYPRVAVIAHEELPPGRNIQPVARISL